jgi:hypothetical protein
VSSRIRVLVHDMPAMLRDILRGVIAKEPDMELLGRTSLLQRPRRSLPGEPDVVVGSTADQQNPAGAEEWLQKWPRARVLLVSPSGRESVLYELRPHATPLGELSPPELVRVIRSGSRNAADATGRGPS